MPIQTHCLQPGCELCNQDGGLVVWRDDDWRLVRVEDVAFPGYYRLISNHHVQEFSQLACEGRIRCMELLAWVERLLIQQLQPRKINLASLGNVVPHLHWHVIARFDWDSHFPSPIWAGPQRSSPPELLQSLRSLLPAVDAMLAAGPAAAGT